MQQKILVVTLVSWILAILLHDSMQQDDHHDGQSQYRASIVSLRIMTNPSILITKPSIWNGPARLAGQRLRNESWSSVEKIQNYPKLLLNNRMYKWYRDYRPHTVSTRKRYQKRKIPFENAWDAMRVYTIEKLSYPLPSIKHAVHHYFSLLALSLP